MTRIRKLREGPAPAAGPERRRGTGGKGTGKGAGKGGAGQVVALPRREAAPEGVVLTPEQRRSRRARSIAIAVALGALALLFYAVTIVKLGPGVLGRPL